MRTSPRRLIVCLGTLDALAGLGDNVTGSSEIVKLGHIFRFYHFSFTCCLALIRDEEKQGLITYKEPAEVKPRH